MVLCEEAFICYLTAGYSVVRSLVIREGAYGPLPVPTKTISSVLGSDCICLSWLTFLMKRQCTCTTADSSPRSLSVIVISSQSLRSPPSAPQPQTVKHHMHLTP